MRYCLKSQFATSALHREEARQFWGRVVGYSGLLIGFGFLAFCLLRLIHYLSEGQ